MSSLTLDGAGRWAEVPQLPPEVERAAARALVDFLREVGSAHRLTSSHITIS